MKKEKLIKSIKNIDDDLICEAMNRRSEETPPIEEKAEIISVSGGKRRSGQLWKYPVTAAALLGVIGGAVFVANNINTVQESMDYSGETRTQTGEETVKTEESTVNNTEGAVTEAIVTQVKPTKNVDIHLWAAFSNEVGFNVLCVDSLPKIPKPTLNKECFSEMSTEELFEYYGLEFLLPKLKNERYSEINDKNVIHGIYTSSDGKIEDINTFVFKNNGEICSDFIDGWNKLTVTIGKSTQFGQEYNYGYTSFRHDKICYYEDNDTFFVVYNVKGCSVMISGKSDEIMHFSDSYKYSVEDFLKINEGISPSSQAFNWDLFRLFTTTIELMSEEEIEKELNIYNEKVSDWYKEIDEITGEIRYQ